MLQLCLVLGIICIILLKQVLIHLQNLSLDKVEETVHLIND